MTQYALPIDAPGAHGAGRRSCRVRIRLRGAPPRLRMRGGRGVQRPLVQLATGLGEDGRFINDIAKDHYPVLMIRAPRRVVEPGGRQAARGRPARPRSATSWPGGTRCTRSSSSRRFQTLAA